jgi:hypothetical protein
MFRRNKYFVKIDYDRVVVVDKHGHVVTVVGESVDAAEQKNLESIAASIADRLNDEACDFAACVLLF